MAIQTADENEEMDSDPDLKNAVSTSLYYVQVERAHLLKKGVLCMECNSQYKLILQLNS